MFEGEGKFGKVKCATNVSTGVAFAVKIVDMKRMEASAKGSAVVEKEMAILRMVTHPNVVALYECIVMHGRMHFVMELCRGGDLFEVPPQIRAPLSCLSMVEYHWALM
jgi:5'-AMP-activated protein kinase catalytic alpha subunit